MNENELQQREAYRLLIDLQLQEYTHTDSDWPGKLRDKAYALLQVYTVSIGGLVVLIENVYSASIVNDHFCLSFWTCVRIAVFLATFILLLRAFYLLRDAIHIKERDVFDSGALKHLMTEKNIDFILLCQLLYDKLAELKKSSALMNTQLSKDIRSSYQSFYVALVLGILTYFICSF